jgi:hypothetical protein
MYLPSLGQPGESRATYLYAHARVGMFLPILTASEANNGQAMLGMTVLVYTSDGEVYRYRIAEVRRHQRSIADALSARGPELWLQTSEGPSPAYPKVQVIALPTGSSAVPAAVAKPQPRPVVCS